VAHRRISNPFPALAVVSKVPGMIVATGYGSVSTGAKTYRHNLFFQSAK
jgi:hypothetical protein